MSVRVLHGVVALAAGAALIAGCSTDTKGDAKQADHDLFDPCTISKDALTATGVDPATESRDIAGVHQEGWKICGWEAPWYFLNIYSTGYTLDDVRHHDTFVDFADVSIGDRKGVTYRTARPEGFDPDQCDVAIGSNHGAYLISVAKKASKPAQGDLCQLAVHHATDLLPQLPN